MQSSKRLRQWPRVFAGRRSRSRRLVTLPSGRNLLTTFTARPPAKSSSPHPSAQIKIQMLHGNYNTNYIFIVHLEVNSRSQFRINHIHVIDYRYDKMEACITPLPEVSDIKEIAGGQLKKWPERLTAVPPRIASGSIEGVTDEMFVEDTKLWQKRVGHYKSVISQFGQKGRYRNLLDMNARFGGFAAALVDDPVWVMNMVPTVGNSTTLGVIYERGLIGSYQDW